MDTAGPSNVLSIGKDKYVLNCEDEASSYRMCAFIDTKDKMKNRLKEFIAKAVLETGNSELKLVTDNGSEFVNAKLKSFLESRGIIHESMWSRPLVPAQNV